MAVYRLFILALLLITVRGICLDGWTRFHGSCYLFVETHKANWQDAQNYCSTFETHLVQIDNDGENKFIKAESKLIHTDHTGPWGYSDCYWTDGNDFDAEGVWMWTTSNTRIEQTFWSPSEPSSINSTTLDEDCINLPLGNNLQWNDDHCDKPCSFICEMEDDANNAIIG